MKTIYSLLALLIFLSACSDYDEQDFTVLIPNAGEDQVIFTAQSGTTVQLDASASSDVNDLGFDVEWQLEEFPEGSFVTLDDPTSLNPTFQVNDETGGRFVWRLILTRGDQITQDVTRIDVNPAIAQVLLVNAVDGANTASLQVDLAEISGEPVAPGQADVTYHNIDTNVSSNADGTVTLKVPFGDNILSLDAELEALNSYTLYVTGTEESPSLSIVTKFLNQNSLPPTLIGLDAINMAPGVDNMQFFIDATALGFGELPIDALFIGLGFPDSFGLLNYSQNKEIVFPAQSVLPLPIWATVNGQRVSNNTFIGLTTGEDGKFGTFLLVKDSNSEFGNTLTFINNSDLLPE